MNSTRAMVLSAVLVLCVPAVLHAQETPAPAPVRRYRAARRPR